MRWCRLRGEALYRAIPQSKFHSIGGGGHGILQWAEAEEVLRGWVLRVREEHSAGG
jgi:hypothetical protein